MMTECTTATYEKIYYAMWEISQRYQDFTQFRVIGNSHDDRMLPMLEVGTGSHVMFCVSGLDGQNQQMPGLLLQMLREYCQFYESSWLLDDFYEVRKLLNEIRICFILMLNPDGYMVCQNGFGAIRNPIYRQMLRMQDTPLELFTGNGRGVCLDQNFPTNYYRKSQMGEEPASENETKAFIRILQEYESRGLIYFHESQQSMISVHAINNRYRLQNRRLARHLKKVSHYQVVKQSCDGEASASFDHSMGSLVQYYADRMKQPAFQIDIRIPPTEEISGPQYLQEIYREMHALPLEFLFSILE